MLNSGWPSSITEFAHGGRDVDGVDALDIGKVLGETVMLFAICSASRRIFKIFIRYIALLRSE